MITLPHSTHTFTKIAVECDVCKNVQMMIATARKITSERKVWWYRRGKPTLFVIREKQTVPSLPDFRKELVWYISKNTNWLLASLKY